MSAAGCHGVGGDQRSKPICSYGDCGGNALVFWGMIPTSPEQVARWDRNEAPLLDMELRRNGVPLTPASLRPAYRADCTRFEDGAEYCINIARPGEICGPELVVVPDPGVVVCVDAAMLERNFPLADGDQFQLTIMYGSSIVVDESATARYSSTELPDDCDNAGELTCRKSSHRYSVLAVPSE